MFVVAQCFHRDSSSLASLPAKRIRKDVNMHVCRLPQTSIPPIPSVGSNQHDYCLARWFSFMQIVHEGGRRRTRSYLNSASLRSGNQTYRLRKQKRLAYALERGRYWIMAIERIEFRGIKVLFSVIGFGKRLGSLSRWILCVPDQINIKQNSLLVTE